MSTFIKSMSKRSKRGMRDSDVVRFARVDRPLVPKGDLITKRLTYSNVLSSTGSGNAIPVTSFTTAQVQSVPAAEWASFAARYQQFRVKSISLILMPYYNVSSQISGSSEMVCLAIGDYLGSAAPASNTQVISDENTVFRIADKNIIHSVNWARNPNAKLWNPTSAALPTANNYAIVLASLNSLANNSAYFTYIVEWDVEFRGAQ
jgi:hypothetical protein